MFMIYLHYCTPVTKYCNLWVYIFGQVANLFFLKIETINCYGVKKWVNGKTKFLVKVLNYFLVWKFELLKNWYLVCENIFLKLIWSRKRHMRGILWWHQLNNVYVAADYCNLFTYFLFLLIFYVRICFTCVFPTNSVNILM